MSFHLHKKSPPPKCRSDGGSGLKVRFVWLQAIRQTSAMSYNTDNNTPRSGGDSSLKGYPPLPNLSTRTCLFPGARPPPAA